jgi:hypothetical protein
MTQDNESLECASAAYQEAIALSDPEQMPNAQFLLDKLMWQSGAKTSDVRERLLAYIRYNPGNEDAIEFFWSSILPQAKHYQGGDIIVIYQDGFQLPHATVSDPAASIEVSDTSVPGNLYQGKNAPALKIKWGKEFRTWASLIVGFDERLPDREIAQAGELVSLPNLEEYRLEFMIKAARGLNNWGEDIIRLKLQDQNLLVDQSIGNQLVCDIRITEDWVAYSIPLSLFVQDVWVSGKYRIDLYTLQDQYDQPAFDPERLKQINFDVPYNARGAGVILMDDIQLVRSSAPSATYASQASLSTTCLNSGFSY